jgi:2,3,4,5-tetrahydropyridine-2-carboxylate N-succinyltransferase
MSGELQTVIDRAWDGRDGIGPDTTGEVRQAVDAALSALDSGTARVAERGAEGWTVNQWLKKAVLLSFRLNPMAPIAGGPGGSFWWDKVPSKFSAGAPRNSVLPAFARCPARSFGAAPLSLRAPC